MKQKEDRQMDFNEMTQDSSQTDLQKKTFMHKSIYDESDKQFSKTSNKTQQEYIDVCSRLAEKSPLTHKHGCIIVRNGKIIAKGFNSQHNIDNSIHAEIAALKNTTKKCIGKNAIMYVVRIGTPQHYRLKYSKPCEKCSSFIEKFRIKKVFYSTNDALNKSA